MNSIQPQSSGESSLMGLPAEIRLRIWDYVLSDSEAFVLEPGTMKNKFWNMNWDARYANHLGNFHALRKYNAIIGTLCRQAYVDIVGGGLLYRQAHFDFRSSYSFVNYLSVVNPAHKEAIRSMQVRMDLVDTKKNYFMDSRRIPPRLIDLLLSCRNFRRLTIRIEEVINHGTGHYWWLARTFEKSWENRLRLLKESCERLRGLELLETFELEVLTWEYESHVPRKWRIFTSEFASKDQRCRELREYLKGFLERGKTANRQLLEKDGV